MTAPSNPYRAFMKEQKSKGVSFKRALRAYRGAKTREARK